ncbi:MAG: ATP-dependent DNA ligase [Devosia sp. 67-54]|uniref:DNA ligase D n=1 Tax=unclassified Devosia TaxID=196773 RepID=UPI000961ECC1|nr:MULTISPECIES: DNA ligase D [unclassified Devosia]MBN9305796.1 DNA ligase D [Devosia sp.]OJX16497.1 MAG: ATP-dependent DNA ligase [Devosia sp. 67-54]
MPATSSDKLKAYNAKRDFGKTAEPAGKPGRRKARALSFVVQKHDATRLHYDFRLELDGVLLSWAVTKGPSTNPADKRLAVRVEDHPLDYGGFEGTIPAGQYGGGTVMLWDEGTWEPIGDPHQGLARGELKFTLKGKRMKGEWVLVHMQGRDQKTRHGTRENWLLIKHDDAYATRSDGLTEKFTTSVETGRDLDGIAKGSTPKRPRKAAGLEVPSANVWTRAGAVALPEFQPPELATLVDDIPTGRDWLFEMKYDGYRALAALAGGQVRLYTRHGNDWTAQFHTLVEPLSTVTKGSALIDGEIVAFKHGKTDFSTLKDALSSGAPLTYFAFDLLELDGEDLRRLPLTERKARLLQLLGKPRASDPVQYSEHIVGEGDKFFAAMCEGGFEGMIAKLGQSPYLGERTRDWLKIKCTQRQEFVIGGWRPSDKKSGFASLLLGTWEGDRLRYRGRVGTGFNAASAAELQQQLDGLARKTSPFADAPRDISRRARWVEPKLVGEVAYSEVTPDNHLRHPSFMGLREDKASREVTLELPAAPPAAAKAKAKPKKATPLPQIELTDAMGIAAADRLGVRLTHPDKIVYEPAITKAQLVAYYDAVAERMLPHIARRPLSLVRLPTGSKTPFFQKHDSGGFPGAFKKVKITETTGPTDIYLYIEDAAGLAANVQMNVLELHIWGSHIDRLEQPDRIIFDIDPDEGLDFAATRQAALDIRDRLGALGLTTYPMVTGGKGIHVIAPLRRTLEWPEVKAFCHAFAERLAADEPDRFTANIRKVNRKGRMFVDYLRNERGATAVCPFSTRAKPGASCAVPLSWDELPDIAAANVFSIAEAAARAQAADPWPDYFKQKQAITKPMLKAVGA